MAIRKRALIFLISLLLSPSLVDAARNTNANCCAGEQSGLLTAAGNGKLITEFTLCVKFASVSIAGADKGNFIAGITGNFQPGNTGGDGFHLAINSNGKASFDVSDEGGNINTATGTTTITQNGNATLWHAICGSAKSEHQALVYLDGVKEGTVGTGDLQCCGATGPVLSTTWQLGTSGGAQYHGFNGSIEDVRLWFVQLTDNEIAAYSNCAPVGKVRPELLVVFWPDFGYDTPEPDYAGGKRSGTIFGTFTQPTEIANDNCGDIFSQGQD